MGTKGSLRFAGTEPMDTNHNTSFDSIGNISAQSGASTSSGSGT
jgi:hypothetical protein